MWFPSVGNRETEVTFPTAAAQQPEVVFSFPTAPRKSKSQLPSNGFQLGSSLRGAQRGLCDWTDANYGTHKAGGYRCFSGHGRYEVRIRIRVGFFFIGYLFGM